MSPEQVPSEPAGFPIPRWKRTADLAIIFLALPVVILLASVIYGWVKLASPGPVLFRQTRIGRGGQRFTIYKFRSMKLGADTQVHEDHVERLVRSQKPLVKLDAQGDPRVIRGGAVLRTSGLDELPQLINVLRGEMSLVGPRPCLPNEFDFYHAHQLHRFNVPPGITGLWQVRRMETATFNEMVRVDLDYVEQMSAEMDCKILLKTPAVLLRQTASVLRQRRDAERPSDVFFSNPQGTAGV